MGNIISRINGISMQTSTYDEVIAFIKKAERPITVHFLRKRGSVAPKPRISVVDAPKPSELAPVKEETKKAEEAALVKSKVAVVEEDEGLFY